jgi:UTP-glucose-1-phosphate uridylyltransferase
MWFIYSDSPLFIAISSMNKLTLVILAAGMWSRYGGLKQMDTFGPHDESLLEYGIYDALRAWFDKIVFVVREYFAEEFKTRIGNRIAQQIEVVYVYQEPTTLLPPEYTHLLESRQKPRGTAHAVLVTKDVVDSPFAVINADDFYGAHAYQQIATFLTSPHPQKMALVGYTLRNTLSPFGSVNRGVCAVHEGTLDHIVERIKIQKDDTWVLADELGTQFTGDEVVSMNFWWFYPAFFCTVEKWFGEFLASYIPEKGGEYFIPLVVDQLITDQQATCAVFQSEDFRCGVTNPEDKPFVQAHIADLVAKGAYPEKLWE